MKTIGLIGGMSWASTIDYYRYLNEMIGERLGELHSARLVLYSVDFGPIEQAQHKGRWDETAHILGEAGSALHSAGADFILICTNTMHKVANEVEATAGLPLLDIRDAVGKSVKAGGIETVGLLGTRFTMTDPFYKNHLSEHFGLRTIVPDESGIEVVHRVIYEELCREIVKNESRSLCLDVVRELVQQGAQGIILGCTELPLLIHPEDVEVPIFDTTRLHAEAAIEMTLAG